MLLEPARKIRAGNGNDKGPVVYVIKGERSEPRIETLNVDPLLDVLDKTIPEYVFLDCVHETGIWGWEKEEKTRANGRKPAGTEGQ